jgi:tRNA pseudouridine38-40 synthase
MRVKAVISYDGSRFFGFQCLKNQKRTISYEIYKSLQKMGINSKIVGSGRTDKGVHATSQVIHFDVPNFWNEPERLKSYLNRHLHPDIHIKKLYFVNENFHARYSVKRRAYRYILTQKNYNPFESKYLHFCKFNPQIIKEGIKTFEGRYDFKYFMKSGSDVKSSFRTIYKTDSYWYKNLFILYFEADGFLRAQVRMMVDFLLKISDDKLTIFHLKEQLEGKKRYSSSLAPPNALYLAKVIY